MKKDFWIGIDTGSVSVQLAVLLPDRETAASVHALLPPEFSEQWRRHFVWLLSPYVRHGGEPLKATLDLYGQISLALGGVSAAGVCCTGGGGKKASAAVSGQYINEIRAVAEGVHNVYPQVRTIFELGGERSKYIQLGPQDSGSPVIVSYGLNGECAAGTGTFFDQQAARLSYDIQEVSRAVLSVKRTANIAGRCSVFAKSDMIHAQQRGYTPPEVLKGLCRAVVRNFKGNVTKGKTIEPAVLLAGGMAMNQGIIDAVSEAFSLSSDDLLVCDLHSWFPAMGAALISRRSGTSSPDRGQGAIRTPLKESIPVTAPLSTDHVTRLEPKVHAFVFPDNTPVPAFLGIDIGSVSTNLALIDTQGELIHGIYTMTRGRPVETVEAALRDMGAAVGGKVTVLGAGTTGSGRELIGALAGADVVKDEITAHRTGAAHVSRQFLGQDVDTIFEIGGQDAKFISIEHGVVVDFALNDACAAGTGSFLEEQAGELGIAIKDEFSRLALSSAAPLRLGERCTVFMEKELIPYLQQGVPKADICAGLALSVVRNYLNRVVKKRKIGERIFFQGGTAFNHSVAAAFATILQKEIIVPPHNGIMGAIGAALLARAAVQKEGSSFRGWNLAAVPRNMREFTCRGCSNHCLIQEFTVEGEKSYWGDKCSEKYRKPVKNAASPAAEDLFAHHENLVFPSKNTAPPEPLRGTVAVPRVLSMYERLPFWRTYFESLGYAVVLSRPGTRQHVERGVETAAADQCFPVQIAHGHVDESALTGADMIFLPNVINEIDPADSVGSFICPWTQTLPLVIRHTKAFAAAVDRIADPNVQFREGMAFVEKNLYHDLAAPAGIKRPLHKEAVARAWRTQAETGAQMILQGQQALKAIHTAGKQAIVLLARPYNLYDRALNLNLPAKLRSLYGLDVLPLDYLPLDAIDIKPLHDHMFWNYGRRIIQGARFVRDYDNLHIIYLSNFKCGPDSYIRHYVQDACGEPYLFLQLDSHANDAGVMTRIEAYLESKKIGS